MIHKSVFPLNFSHFYVNIIKDDRRNRIILLVNGKQ